MSETPMFPGLEKRALFAVLALFVLALSAYANSLSGVFVFDDHHAIEQNSSIRSLAGPWSVFFAPGRSVYDYTLALNFAMGGLSVTGFHVVNIAIHLLGGLTLFDLTRRLLLREPQSSPLRADATALAFAASALWLVHPLQTESVSYIVHRSEALMGFFYLAMLDALVRGAESTRFRHAWYGVALVACALGMKSKEVMVTAPVAALLFDRVYLASSWREVRSSRWALHLGLFATWSLLVRSASQAFSNVPSSAGFHTYNVTAIEYAINQPSVILHYLRLAVVPHPLCLDWNWPIGTLASQLVPIAALGLLVGASLGLLVRRPKLGLLAFAFFLTLSPTSSILPISDLAAERRMYLPLAPLIVLAVVTVRLGLARAVAAGWPERRLSLAAGVVASSAVLVFLTLTICRNFDYSSEMGMWRRVLVVVPDNARAHAAIGLALDRMGQSSLAENAYRESLRYRSLSDCRNNYGGFLVRLGRPEEAVVQLRQAVLGNPKLVEAWSNLAAAQWQLGNQSEALAACEHALALDPNRSGVHMMLATIYERQNQLELAEKHLRAMANDPESSKRLGRFLLRTGRPREAVPLLAQALRASAGDALLVSDLAFALTESGDEQAGREMFLQARRLDPHWHRKAADAAWLMATNADPKVRDGARAVWLSRQALRGSEGKDPAVLDSLAAAQAEVGQFNEAVKTAELARSRFAEISNPLGVAAVDGRIKTYASSRPFRGERGYP